MMLPHGVGELSEPRPDPTLAERERGLVDPARRRRTSTNELRDLQVAGEPNIAALVKDTKRFVSLH